MPLTITEELTNQTWVLPPPTQFLFLFNGPPWIPGVYKIVNTINGSINVVIFGQSYIIDDQTIWRIMAHPDLESFDWIGGAPPVGQWRYPLNLQVGIGPSP